MLCSTHLDGGLAKGRDDTIKTMKSKRKIIAIVGPTASGKTAVAVKLARKLNGEIVSADSRQVFRGMDLGTGKDLSEYGDVKYHLIDIKNPGEKFTLFDYLPLARAAIEDIFSRGKIPIVVGGTGLYVQGLIEGFQLVSSQHSAFSSQQSREQLSNLTIEELQNILNDLDAEAFEKVDKQNPHRLIRAIEKAQSGEVVTKTKPDFEVLQIGMDWPREELYGRIDRRTDERFEQGMLNEVVDLINAGADVDWLLSLGLEYKIIGNFVISNLRFLISNEKKSSKIKNLKLNKNLELKIKNSGEFEAMKNQLKLRSHQYAKRQLTWFRRFPEIVWEKDYQNVENRAEIFLN